MLWLLVLLGCGGRCATDPGDLEITDPEGVASEDDQGWAEQGLANFVRWTERDAICATRITFADELEVSWTDDVVGTYDRDSKRVELEAGRGAWTGGTTQHELCHALDHTEGISADHPDLFDPERHGGILNYPEESRVREAFARDCAPGPRPDAYEAVADLCGGAWERPEHERFLAEAVYRGVAPVDVQIGDLGVAWQEVLLADGWRVQDAVATFGGLAAVVIDDNEQSIHALLISPDGRVTVDVILGTLGEGDWVPVPWNGGAGFVGMDVQSVLVGSDGSVGEAPGLGEDAELVWDDVIFVREAVDVIDGGVIDMVVNELVGRDVATGERVELGLDPAWLAEYQNGVRVHPANGQVAVVGRDSRVVGTPATGWAYEPGVEFAFPLGDGWLSAASVYGDGTQLTVLLLTHADGRVVMSDDACTPSSWRLWSMGETPVLVENVQGPMIRFGFVNGG